MDERTAREEYLAHQRNVRASDRINQAIQDTQLGRRVSVRDKGELQDKGNAWHDLRSKVHEKKSEYHRFASEISVGNLNTGTDVEFYTSPSEKVNYHESVGTERKLALSKLIDDIELHKGNEKAEYHTIAESTRSLTESFESYFREKADRKLSIESVRKSALAVRNEFYDILLFEGYTPEDIRGNTDIEEAFQMLLINQTADPDMRRAMEIVRKVRKRIQTLEKEKVELENKRYKLLEAEGVAERIAEIDAEISEIVEPAYLEYTKNIQRLDKRLNYLFDKNMASLDADILNPESRWNDELLLAKYSYLQVGIAGIKAGAIVDSLWPLGLYGDEGQYLVQSIFADFDAEGIEDLVELKEMLTEAYPLNFDDIENRYLNVLAGYDIESVEEFEELVRKSNLITEGIKKHPARMLTEEDEIILNNYYDSLFDDLTNAYEDQILETEYLEKEKQHIMAVHAGDINQRLKALDTMIKTQYAETFGRNPKLEAAEQLLLTGSQFYGDKQALGALKTLETSERE